VVRIRASLHRLLKSDSAMLFLKGHGFKPRREMPQNQCGFSR
jgi:glutaredoxin-related protein